MPPSKKKSTSDRRPQRFWHIVFLVLCALGILLSAYLLNLHVRVHTDPDYQSLCAMSEQVNCETVALSNYAVFGGLPWALWGLIGYIFMSGLCCRGLRSPRQPESWPFGILFWLSVISSLVSIVLFGISHFLIRSFCVVCAATYIANFLLIGIAFAELRRTGSGPLSAIRAELRGLKSRKKPALFYLASFAAVVGILLVALPAYWKIGVSTGPGGLLVGTTPDEFHWIGARAPVLDITDFSDYQCPHCSRGHNEIRELIAKYPDKVRLVHRHYPLKRHPFAFLYSKMAYCAGRQGRFWEANDYLFEHGRRREQITPKELAGAIQIDAADLTVCAESNPANQAVLDDLAAGKAFNIQGTPTYVVGSKVYPGRIPKEVIASALSITMGAAQK